MVFSGVVILNFLFPELGSDSGNYFLLFLIWIVIPGGVILTVSAFNLDLFKMGFVGTIMGAFGYFASNQWAPGLFSAVGFSLLVSGGIMMLPILLDMIGFGWEHPNWLVKIYAGFVTLVVLGGSFIIIPFGGLFAKSLLVLVFPVVIFSLIIPLCYLKRKQRGRT